MSRVRPFPWSYNAAQDRWKKARAERWSLRRYRNVPISLSDVSQLLWAALAVFLKKRRYLFTSPPFTWKKKRAAHRDGPQKCMALISS